MPQEGGWLRTRPEVAESYFSQFVWSKYHPRNRIEHASICSMH
ncbi:hypothetical protein [Burkholderia catarinensis]|nr:hypothetical protein [Burkholderia catarinensis]